MASKKTIDLGVMTQVDNLRSIWPGEASDFTPWLAQEQNLKLLGEAIGIDLVLEEKESSVGEYYVDIFAKEEGLIEKLLLRISLKLPTMTILVRLLPMLLVSPQM